MWAVGLALVGVILGSKGSYATTWHGELMDDYPFILGGGAVGSIIGLIFS
jgi:hypothetical protein